MTNTSKKVQQLRALFFIVYGEMIDNKYTELTDEEIYNQVVAIAEHFKNKD